jgi:hypothetical protein
MMMRVICAALIGQLDRFAGSPVGDFRFTLHGNGRQRTH